MINIMPESIHQKIVNEIIDEQKKDPSVIVINIFGSLAQGLERLESDVDIEIVSTKAKEWKLIKQEKYGIKIDFEIWPKDKLLERIKKYPFLSYVFLKEKIVYDPGNFMKKINNQLKKYFDQNPKIAEFWEKKYKAMKKAKEEGEQPEDLIKVYDEAEIRFSKKHKVTRDFFRRKENI